MRLGRFGRRVLAKLNRELDQVRGPLTVRRTGKQRALLSYIVHPFRRDTPLTHCNIIESIQMADVLAELGYQVDVVDYRHTRAIDYSRYDLLLGFGLPFARSFHTPACTAKRINYMTGANPHFTNTAEAKRIAALRARKGRGVRPRREVYHPWTNAAVNADGLIVTGNAWTASTYAELNHRIYTVPVPYLTTPRLPATDAVQRGFVWFGGNGAVHKGLDLVLDAVTLAGGRYQLDVCGLMKHEQDFCDLYVDALTRNPQVTQWGLIDPNSRAMDEIAQRNAFVILPSCSEGSASSVITCMARGLIPVVTRESGIALQGFGIEIADASVESVSRAMQTAVVLPDNAIHRQRAAVVAHVQEYHSPAAFRSCFGQAVEEILKAQAHDRL